MKNQLEELKETVLTQKMDVGTQGFDEFQAVLLEKSKKRTENQKKGK